MTRNLSRAQHAGTFPDNLTPAEHKAVQAVVAHGQDKMAADAVGVSVTTLRTQTHNAMRKAGVRNRVRLVVLYLGSQAR